MNKPMTAKSKLSKRMDIFPCAFFMDVARVKSGEF